jgi:invasion protein IalB
MRASKTLKLTFHDTNSRPIAIAIPLPGFGLALDKVK